MENNIKYQQNQQIYHKLEVVLKSGHKAFWETESFITK